MTFIAARPRISRRGFFKLGATAGTGLILGYSFPRLRDNDAPRSLSGHPALWLKIAPDDRITVIVPRCEMGQGVTTALAMLVAEELEVDWPRIRTEWAPIEPAYGRQLTGASDSVRTLWTPLREAAALAREQMTRAAAREWDVHPAECHAEKGRVIHGPTDRALTYGALADAAAAMPLPRRFRLKTPEQFRILGRPLTRLDLEDKITGRTVYGSDVRLLGMLAAAVLHSPAHRGRLVELDASEARAIPGVHDIVCLETEDGSACVAVAVVADNSWAAQRGAAAVRAIWDDGPADDASTASISRLLARLALREGKRIVDRGLADPAVATAARSLDAIYEAPYLAHGTMEPVTCAAVVEHDRCDVWVPTQLPTLAREIAARTAGLPLHAVTIHQTYLGGGFGRRQRADVVAEAVRLAKVVGRPVQVLWSREEDLRQDHYRPATYHRLRAGIDANGALVGWIHQIAGIGGTDDLLVQGIDEVPYRVPNKRISLVRQRTGPVQTGPWRGLARSQNTFVTECFLDEIAHAAGRDPLRLREELLSGAPRHLAVLKTATERAGWGQPLPPGRYRGLALGENFGGICAEVAEISIAEKGSVRVHRVVCACDCGPVVNPDIVIAQMEGGIIFGLSAALGEEITIAAGRVQQSNFHDYRVLRMHEAPAIEVSLVSGGEAPGGVGETAVPAIAPAVANALFAATGMPVRRLPIHRVGA